MFQIGGNSTAAWEVMKNTYLNFQSAFAYTPNQKQPYYNLKMMGYGALTMQGLETYVVDGSFGAMLRMTPKYQLLNFHIRNFVKNKNYNDIPVRVFLKAYGNIGYVFNNNNNPDLQNTMPNKFLHTAGFGIDFITIYDVVLKLEYSYNQFGQKGFFIRTASDF
jgi:opacity protein-like surface antigen